MLRTTLEDKRPDEILTLEDVKKGAASLEELVAQLTVEEMADLCVGTERLEEGGNVIGSSSACVPGAAGDTTSALIEKRKIPNLILADGPAGLRLQTHFKTDKEGNKLPGGEQFGMEIAPFAKEHRKERRIITSTVRQSRLRRHLRSHGMWILSREWVRLSEKRWNSFIFTCGWHRA